MKVEVTSRTLAQRDAFADTLLELMRADERVYVLDGDLANSTRADRVAQQLPERFLEMGIAEQNMMGVAAGMATCGLIPWLSSFACFLTNRDLDQLRVVVAQPRLNVKIGAAYSGILTAKTGKTHQEVSDLAIMRAMPHMTVVAPADAVEVRLAMLAANAWDGPVYLRLTRDPSPVIFAEDEAISGGQRPAAASPVGPAPGATRHAFAIGRAALLREGGDVAIISTGVQTVRSLQAADLLAQEGIGVYLLHVSTLKPLDTEAIVQAASRTRRVVTAEDHTVIGGLGGAVAEVLGEHLPTPMRRVGIADTFGESAPDADLLRKYGLTPEHVAAAARALLESS
ncbi:MAG: transketolase C-terminal domain-containing protein [Candidatus Latescibacterota bacterium]